MELGALNFFVGANGSGKSNFLDALEFVADAANISLDYAVRSRGGVSEISNKDGIPNSMFSIAFDFALPDSTKGEFSVTVGLNEQSETVIYHEKCSITSQELSESSFYSVDAGIIAESTITSPPKLQHDRLSLIRISGDDSFTPIFNAICSMRVYNFSPVVIAGSRPVDTHHRLRPDGGNAASIFAKLTKLQKDRILDFLSAITPGISTIFAHQTGRDETLALMKRLGDGHTESLFFGSSMSDGTLRAIAILVALSQNYEDQSQNASLIAIEEPEIALHPAATAAIYDALEEASALCQILVTSHSPELLDRKGISPESIIVVSEEYGATQLRPLDQVGTKCVIDDLTTPGELLRMGQLLPAHS